MPIMSVGGFNPVRGRTADVPTARLNSPGGGATPIRFSWPVVVVTATALFIAGCFANAADGVDERSLDAGSVASPDPNLSGVSGTGFTAITAGDNHTCGLRPSGDIACWGRNDSDQASPYFGAFHSVAAGGDQTCGLRPSGEA